MPDGLRALPGYDNKQQTLAVIGCYKPHSLAFDWLTPELHQ